MLTKLLHRLAYLDLLLRKRATGCPKELANRLGITERAWYKIRDELINDVGLPIAYDPHLKTYYYTEAGQFVFQFVRKLDTDDMEKLAGGDLLTHFDWQLTPSSFSSLNELYNSITNSH